MEKLPPTSYVRMVDVWLIFGQLIPFVEVTILTIRELYNDEREHINHHGTAIDVVNPVSINPPSHLLKNLQSVERENFYFFSTVDGGVEAIYKHSFNN